MHGGMGRVQSKPPDCIRSIRLEQKSNGRIMGRMFTSSRMACPTCMGRPNLVLYDGENYFPGSDQGLSRLSILFPLARNYWGGPATGQKWEALFTPSSSAQTQPKQMAINWEFHTSLSRCIEQIWLCTFCNLESVHVIKLKCQNLTV